MRQAEAILTSAALGVNSMVSNHFGESKTIRTKTWSFGDVVALNRYNLRQSWGPVQVSCGLCSGRLRLCCETTLPNLPRRSVPRLFPPLLTVRVGRETLYSLVSSQGSAWPKASSFAVDGEFDRFACLTNSFCDVGALDGPTIRGRCFDVDRSGRKGTAPHLTGVLQERLTEPVIPRPSTTPQTLAPGYDPGRIGA